MIVEFYPVETFLENPMSIVCLELDFRFHKGSVETQHACKGFLGVEMWRCAAAAPGAGVWHFLCKTKATSSASSWAAHPHDFTKCRVLHRLNVEGRRLGGQTHDGDGTETRERKSTMWNLYWKKKFVFVFSDRQIIFIYFIWKILFRLLLFARVLSVKNLKSYWHK